MKVQFDQSSYNNVGKKSCLVRLLITTKVVYLGMAVQLYVQAHLGHYHILTQKEYSQKLMAQLKSTPLLPIYAQHEN